jgi:AcrR family transcriptional regulator
VTAAGTTTGSSHRAPAIESTGGSGSRRRGRPRDAGADDVILEAAAQVLAEQGLAGFTVDAIAARAGCGKATIYRRWPSRSELLLATAHCTAVEVPEPDTGSLRDDLLILLGSLATKMCDTIAGQALPAVVAEAAVNPEMRETFAQFILERRSRACRVIRRGIDRGELRDVDVDLVADLLAGPLFQRILFHHLPIDGQLVERTIDAVLEGVVAR